MSRPASPTALIFDWDNTLVDTWPTIHEALNVMLPQMGHAPWAIEETKQRVRQSLRDAFPGLFGVRWQEARKIYLEAFEAIHLDRLRPLPGAAALLAGLCAEGRFLAVVSNKTGHLLRREVEALGWGGYFARVVGAGDAVRDKPDRAPIDLALADSAHVASARVWFVGDTGIDMECAHNAGCLPVLVHGAAPVCAPGGEYHLVPPALHFPDCAALARAIMTGPACNQA
ncbi:MAG: HAD family hydrolase [Aliidongia sp.]